MIRTRSVANSTGGSGEVTNGTVLQNLTCVLPVSGSRTCVLNGHVQAGVDGQRERAAVGDKGLGKRGVFEIQISKKSKMSSRLPCPRSVD